MTATQQLIERVAARTSGTKGDPLSIDEVTKVVEATIAEVHKDPEAFIAIFSPEA